jgi:hypothetical protein
MTDPELPPRRGIQKYAELRRTYGERFLKELRESGGFHGIKD